MSLQLTRTAPSSQFHSYDLLQSSRSLWGQEPQMMNPHLPAEIRMIIYTNYLLSSPWHLNHPRETRYEGPTLAPVPSRHTHQPLGYTFRTTFNEGETGNASPNDFGLSWSSSKHDSTKTETNLYNEYVFKIDVDNINRLKDWNPPLPIEKYRRVVLRIQPQGFTQIQGIRPTLTNPAIPHQNMALQLWSPHSPHVDTILSFTAKYTSLHSLHICIEEKHPDPEPGRFKKWFGSLAMVGTKRRVTLFLRGFEGMYSNLALSHVSTGKQWKYVIVSARKSIGGVGIWESHEKPFRPGWLPGEETSSPLVEAQVLVRLETAAGRAECAAAVAEMNVVKDWEREWLGRARGERLALRA